MDAVSLPLSLSNELGAS